MDLNFSLSTSCLLCPFSVQVPQTNRDMKTSSLLLLLLLAASGDCDDVKYISKRNSGRMKSLSVCFPQDHLKCLKPPLFFIFGNTSNVSVDLFSVSSQVVFFSFESAPLFNLILVKWALLFTSWASFFPLVFCDALTCLNLMLCLWNICFFNLENCSLLHLRLTLLHLFGFWCQWGITRAAYDRSADYRWFIINLLCRSYWRFRLANRCIVHTLYDTVCSESEMWDELFICCLGFSSRLLLLVQNFSPAVFQLEVLQLWKVLSASVIVLHCTLAKFWKWQKHRKWLSSF